MKQKSLAFLIILGTFQSALAERAPDPIALGALEVRVGEYTTALKLLEAYEASDENDRSASEFVRARALFGLGRHEESLKHLRGVARRELALPSAWLTFQIAVVLGDDQETLRAVAQIKRAGSLPSRLDAQLKIEVSRIGLGDRRKVDGARDALKRLLTHRDRSVRARAMSILADEGDLSLMARLLVEYPDTEQARRRSHFRKRVSLSLEQRSARADELFRFRAYDLAAPAYEELMTSGDPATRQKASLRRATIQMRMREGYEKSRIYLEKARRGPEVRWTRDASYRLGLVYGHLGRHDAGRTMMETFLSEGGKGRRRVNAHYQVGRLMHEAGRYKESLAAHRVFLKTKPPDRSMWRWFEAWTLFRSGDYPGARAILKRLSRSKNLLVGAKALYWTARCHRLEGHYDRAEATLITLGKRAPLSYYGLLGATMRGQIPPRRIARVRVPTVRHLGKWTQKLSKKVASNVAVVRTLVRVGELTLARHVSQEKKLRASVSRNLPRHLKAMAVDELDILLERWGDRWKTLSKSERRIPWKDGLAERKSSTRERAYPPAYYSLAVAAGRAHDVSPWWLIAHMLQESRYKERAKSHAVALGTMQILPRTGRRIADRLGFPNGDFTADQLFKAGVGLRQAAWYLDALRREFNGNMVLAIAAYNGGPRRLAQHVRTVGDVPFDVLIEEIGAHETRNYVRKVTDHLLRHLDMYADDAERTRVLKSLLPPDSPVKARGELRF
jgi:soluble lytic murein transglycosylase